MIRFKSKIFTHFLAVVLSCQSLSFAGLNGQLDVDSGMFQEEVQNGGDSQLTTSVEEKKAKRAEYARAYYAKPENKAKRADYDRARRANPEKREKIRECVRAWYAKPENKAKSIGWKRTWLAKKNREEEELAAVANKNPEALQRLQSRIEEVQSKASTASEHNAFVEAYNEKIGGNDTGSIGIISELVDSAVNFPAEDYSQEGSDEAAKLRDGLGDLVKPDESIEEQINEEQKKWVDSVLIL